LREGHVPRSTGAGGEIPLLMTLEDRPTPRWYQHSVNLSLSGEVPVALLRHGGTILAWKMWGLETGEHSAVTAEM
jgi:hypothetical protein